MDFAVNQQAELLIFEVERGIVPFITAHVLIRYEGEPEKFAWLIPVPSVPELSLSHTEAFGLIDERTRPTVTVNRRNLCPEQRYQCQTHPLPNCSPTRSSDGNWAAGAGGQLSAPSNGAGGAFGFDNQAPPVVVHARQDVGDYETVTIGAGDGQAAVAWLNEQGFIVNASMGKYMQPYLDAGMLFLASKLQPDADVDELRPLRMRYAGDTPAIPLRLTAVAAEPHLTVTALIYADGPYEPFGHPMFEVEPDVLGSPDGLSHNYGATLSRLVDEAGGDGFALEYYGPPPTYQETNLTCCVNGNGLGQDPCSVADNGACECPLSTVDETDCGGEDGIDAALGLVNALATKYPRVTRLTTRLSPEEMTFDPVFRPMWGEEPAVGRRTHVAEHSELTACRGDVIDAAAYEAVRTRQACAALYCGPDAECAVTATGVGCVCSGTELARVFTDLDGTRAVTCVPQVGTVDFGAGGIALPNACDGRPAPDNGECFDIGGFPAVLCDAGHAAVTTGGALPDCAPVVEMTDGPGAENYTTGVQDMEVCAPAPPTCPSYGWLVERQVSRPGVTCEHSVPDPSWLVEPDKPTCDMLTGSSAPSVTSMRETAMPRPDLPTGSDDGGCGCRVTGGRSSGSTGGALLSLVLTGMLWTRRRRAAAAVQAEHGRDRGC